eukprot:6233337-Amphidinium_carterae.1
MKLRGVRKRRCENAPDFEQVFHEALPARIPDTLQQWHDDVNNAMKIAQNACQPAPNNTTHHWDDIAKGLRDARQKVHGWERRQLSKQLYLHLKTVKAKAKLKECMDKRAGLFNAFGRGATRRTIPISEEGSLLKPHEAILEFERQLGAKVLAMKEISCNENNFSFHVDASADLFADIQCPTVRHYRSHIGKGKGLDEISPLTVKYIPEEWLVCLPKCFQTSFTQGAVAAANWNSQRMIPLPKQKRAKLTAQNYRGIAISNVTRGLSTVLLLQAIHHHFTDDSPISFAYTSNRNAESLQLCLAQATRVMTKWYGEVCVAKTDISSAFDTVPWSKLLTALTKKLPEQLAVALLQTQLA